MEDTNYNASLGCGISSIEPVESLKITSVSSDSYGGWYDLANTLKTTSDLSLKINTDSGIIVYVEPTYTTSFKWTPITEDESTSVVDEPVKIYRAKRNFRKITIK